MDNSRKIGGELFLKYLEESFEKAISKCRNLRGSLLLGKNLNFVAESFRVYFEKQEKRVDYVDVLGEETLVELVLDNFLEMEKMFREKLFQLFERQEMLEVEEPRFGLKEIQGFQSALREVELVDGGFGRAHELQYRKRELDAYEFEHLVSKLVLYLQHRWSGVEGEHLDGSLKPGLGLRTQATDLPERRLRRLQFVAVEFLGYDCESFEFLGGLIPDSELNLDDFRANDLGAEVEFDLFIPEKTLAALEKAGFSVHFFELAPVPGLFVQGLLALGAIENVAVENIAALRATPELERGEIELAETIGRDEGPLGLRGAEVDDILAAVVLGPGFGDFFLDLLEAPLLFRELLRFSEVELAALDAESLVDEADLAQLGLI